MHTWFRTAVAAIALSLVPLGASLEENFPFGVDINASKEAINVVDVRMTVGELKCQISGSREQLEPLTDMTIPKNELLICGLQTKDDGAAIYFRVETKEEKCPVLVAVVFGQLRVGPDPDDLLPPFSCSDYIFSRDGNTSVTINPK